MVGKVLLDDRIEGIDAERITRLVATDVGEPADQVRAAVERVIRLALEPDGDVDAATLVEADSEGAARDGLLPEQLIDRYLSTLWALWAVRAPETESRAELVALGDRMLRTADALVAAVAVGYRAVERELIVNNAEARRAFIDELLGVVAVDAATIGRLRRRSARLGLDPRGTYRLIATASTIHDDDAHAELLAVRIRSRLPGRSVADRARAGVVLPQVVAWRGQVVMLVRASWPGIAQFRESLADAVGPSATAVISAPVNGVERLAPSMARLLEALRTALRLGRTGWIDDPDDLAVERLMLADDALLATVVDRELGPLLADPRMGEELVETLQVYFDTGENMRATARRLHLANRTVAYRLDRIKTLLGHPLDGPSRQRLVVALLAHRILRGSRD
jgi:DNA-binding PucR family transcriptional regulator